MDPRAPRHHPDEAPITVLPRSSVPGPGTPLEQVLFEVKRLIVGQDRMLERILVGLLAGGHVLIEGVPGIAKTATVKALGTALGCSFGRVQFTPDLVPADLIGTRIYNPKSAEFSTELGPVFCSLLLADEINRAPAKVQSALLEIMQEHQVTIGKETFATPEPFMVLATQNPIEADGTYPLPEAQLDRFMLKVLVGYPSLTEEIVVVSRITGKPIELRQILSAPQLLELQAAASAIYVDPVVLGYAAKLTTATRKPAESGLPEFAAAIAYGASPRATIHLVAASRALALIRGREYVLPQDVADLAPEVIRHRLLLSYEGIAAGVDSEQVIGALLERNPPPRIDLRDRAV
ncbi:MAG TPA: MoxR family ATPase [Candidatus Dormibacteraeota bacterium]|jgi:MoxR-like ATPase